MNPMACISVIVPCYNASAWIASSLRSVLAQDWPSLEVLVVDDGSTDGSVELVRERFPEVKVLQQQNAGAAAARNTGIQAARGDWVAFVDADDWWAPGKLRAQMDLLSSHPEARMCCSAWQVWPSDEPEPDPGLRQRLDLFDPGDGQGRSAAGWIYPELLVGCCVWTSTVLARTELLRQLGGFDAGLKIGEDYDLWLRASRLTPIVRVQRPLALYRQHPHSLTKQPPAINYEATVVGRALKQWGYRSPDGRRARRADVARSLARTWHTYGAAHLEAGHLSQALTGALKSIALHWRAPDGWKLTAKALWRSLPTAGAPQRT